MDIPPRKIKEKNYCSVSCSNKDNPRREKLPLPKCEKCENLATRRNAKYCKGCHIIQNCSFHLVTIGELREKRKDATRYSQVRGHARLVLEKSDIEKKCKNCQYDKHVQVCHIKDICSFSDIDTVAKVNSINNLVYLCPNCHWEFDHNSLKL